VQEFPSEEAPGLSVFYKNANGEIFHTYSSYGRGLDILLGAYNFLDMTPKGRDEDGLAFSMAWVRHHDRYEDGYQVASAPQPGPAIAGRRRHRLRCHDRQNPPAESSAFPAGVFLLQWLWPERCFPARRGLRIKVRFFLFVCCRLRILVTSSHVCTQKPPGVLSFSVSPHVFSP
jgi:hypothetical protein